MKSKNSTQSNVKPSDILREAANMLTNNRFDDGCCAAIKKASIKLGYEFSSKSQVYKMFKGLFERKDCAYWFGYPDFIGWSEVNNESVAKTLEGRREHRVMSLLLCADMAESVDL